MGKGSGEKERDLKRGKKLTGNLRKRGENSVFILPKKKYEICQFVQNKNGILEAVKWLCAAMLSLKNRKAENYYYSGSCMI